MPESLEAFMPRHLSMELEIDLVAHQVKLLVNGLFPLEVRAKLCKCLASSFNLPLLDQLARRLRHECQEPQNEDDTPRDLYTKRDSPLNGPIWCIAAGKADPVRQEVSQCNTAASNTTDKATICGRRNLAEVDWNRRGETTSRRQ